MIHLSSCFVARHNHRFILPPHFEGCVIISYGIEGAPPLPEEDGFYLIKIPPGVEHIWTSSLPRANDERYVNQYYYETSVGERNVAVGTGSGLWKFPDGTFEGRFCFSKRERPLPRVFQESGRPSPVLDRNDW